MLTAATAGTEVEAVAVVVEEETAAAVEVVLAVVGTADSDALLVRAGEAAAMGKKASRSFGR